MYLILSGLLPCAYLPPHVDVAAAGFVPVPTWVNGYESIVAFLLAFMLWWALKWNRFVVHSLVLGKIMAF